MSKKEEIVEDVKVNQPDNAPIAPEAIQAVDRSVQAHQWQKDSAAVNTNVLAGYAEGQNAVAEANKEDEKPKKEKKEKISEAEKERRGKLDVSHADYLNPSLDY